MKLTYVDVKQDWFKRWSLKGCSLTVIRKDTGEHITRVVACDLRNGWIERHRLDDQGIPVIVNNDLVRERIMGDYELIVNGDDPLPVEAFNATA